MDVLSRCVHRDQVKKMVHNKGKKKGVKVVYISSPMKVKTSASKFRTLVQQLTGRDSDTARLMMEEEEHSSINSHALANSMQSCSEDSSADDESLLYQQRQQQQQPWDWEESFPFSSLFVTDHSNNHHDYLDVLTSFDAAVR